MKRPNIGEASPRIGRIGSERRDGAGLSEHLIHVAGVQFLCLNHLPRIFLEHYRRALDGEQKLLVEREGLALGCERLPQNGADVGSVSVQQRSDRQG